MYVFMERWQSPDYCDGFENHWTQKGSQGSNPCLSANLSSFLIKKLDNIKMVKWQSGLMCLLGKQVYGEIGTVGSNPTFTAK